MTQDDTQLAHYEPSAGAQPYNWVGLDPRQIANVAKAMALSGMFPDINRDSAKAYVKIMAGQEMGIPPFQAMSDISIISGKAAAGGNIYAAKVKAHPKYDYKVHDWTTKGCKIEFLQMADGKYRTLGVSQFDENDAQTAGLLGKGNWKTYPRNMYFNRAMTAGVRTFCPDALNGINAYTPEELGAEVDEDGRAVVENTVSYPQADVSPTEDVPVDKSELSTGGEESEQNPDWLNQDIVDLADKVARAKPKYVVPRFPEAANSKMMHPKMQIQIKQWIEELELNEAEVATFVAAATNGKETISNRDDGQAMLELLAEELNLRAAAQEAA